MNSFLKKNEAKIKPASCRRSKLFCYRDLDGIKCYLSVIE